MMDLLQKQATLDELTGLPNRRAFTDTAENIFRASETVSLFILDVDHFKKINDTYGHDTGDEVLKALAGAGRALRVSSISSRGLARSLWPCCRRQT